MWLIKAHTSQEAPTSTSGSSSPAKALALGIAEMFLPAVLVTKLSFKDYLIIWFERVVLSILVSIPLIYLVKVLM